MAGFTDVAFRTLCKAYGADVVETEFVQAIPLVRDVERTWRTIDFTEAQRPAGVQIFGAVPSLMAQAARLLEERLHPDFIDLNFGCPARKVVEQNAGAGLLRDPVLAAQIASAVVQAVPETPVTVKMRIGWDSTGIVAVDVARRLENAGVRVIAVHGRTKTQGYSGEANWEEIARVAAAVSVPVIGNGDIRDSATALKRWRESGVAGLMIGRAALGNPWLFAEIKAVLQGAPSPSPPTAGERLKTLVSYAEMLVTNSDSTDDSNGTNGTGAVDVRWMLTKLFPLIQRLSGARKFRARLSECRSLDDIRRLCSSADASALTGNGTDDSNGVDGTDADSAM
jgi:nifR3 family TIM-barrel protein